MSFRAFKVALLLSFTAGALARADDWQAGASKVRITPRQPMWMSGYAGRKTPAEGTQTDLFAKSLVLQDSAGHKAIVVSLDLVGIPRDISQKTCQAIAEKHKVERSQIAIFVSHTHCGPVVGNNLRAMVALEPAQEQLIDDYALELQANILQAVEEAHAKLAPAKLAWANGHATFAVNRRNNKEAEVPEVRAKGGLVGPVDYEVPVLSVRRPDGKLAAVLFGYACHATVLPFMKWCADYPGYAQIELEKSHPEAVALFFAGCGADQNPLPRREVPLAEHYGRVLATAVDAVLNGVMTPIDGGLRTAYDETALPLGPLPSVDQLKAAAADEKNVYEMRRAKFLLKQVEGGTPLSSTYPYPVQVWRLGKDLRLVTLGGEVVVDYSIRLKTELGRGPTWVAGYSNDVMAYIPSLRVLKEGGYEGATSMVYYCLPTTWAPSVEETIVDSVHKLAKSLNETK